MKVSEKIVQRLNVDIAEGKVPTKVKALSENAEAHRGRMGWNDAWVWTWFLFDPKNPHLDIGSYDKMTDLIKQSNWTYSVCEFGNITVSYAESTR